MEKGKMKISNEELEKVLENITAYYNVERLTAFLLKKYVEPDMLKKGKLVVETVGIGLFNFGFYSNTDDKSLVNLYSDMLIEKDKSVEDVNVKSFNQSVFAEGEVTLKDDLYRITCNKSSYQELVIDGNELLKRSSVVPLEKAYIIKSNKIVDVTNKVFTNKK